MDNLIEFYNIHTEFPDVLKNKLMSIGNLKNWPSVNFIYDWSTDSYSNEEDDTIAYYNEVKNSIMIHGPSFKYNDSYKIPENLLIHECIHAYQYKAKHWYWNEFELIEATADIISAGICKNIDVIGYWDEVQSIWTSLRMINNFTLDNMQNVLTNYVINKNWFNDHYKNKADYLIKNKLMNKKITKMPMDLVREELNYVINKWSNI